MSRTAEERIELEVHLVHLGQHRHRGGGGVDAAAGLGLRHPLHPVDAALKFQPGVGPVPLDGEADLLDAAQLGLVHRVHLHLPAAGVGVHGVHAEQGVGEQGRLLPAHAGPDLHDHVLVIVGIPGQQEHLDLLLQPGHVLLGLVELLLGQLLHVRVAHQRLGVRQILPAALVGPVGSDHRLQLPLLLVELRHQGGVVIGLRRAKPGLHIRVVEIQRA